jgi:hypothetical protein
MKQLLEALRIIIVSFEALFLLIIAAIYSYSPEIIIFVGNHFKINNDIWKFIPTVPLILCGFSIKYAWKILMPLEGNNSNRLLHEWPNYWKLKYRVIVSAALCVICVFGSFTIWFFNSSLSSLMVGAIFIATIIVSFTAVASEFLAAFRVRELMEP